MAWWTFGSSGTLVSAITSTPNLRTTSSIDFRVSSIPSTIGASSGLALSATSSARSRLSITGSSSLTNFSSANLCAFSISCSVRRRRLSSSALARSITSRSRFCASASWASRFAIFSSRGSTCSAETSGSTASTSSCCSVIISSGACPSGVFCSLLLMNFSAFFSHSSR